MLLHNPKHLPDFGSWEPEDQKPISNSFKTQLPFSLKIDFVDEYHHLLPLDKIERGLHHKDVTRFKWAQKKTQESFGYQWLRYDVNNDREDRDIFFSDSQLSENELQNKLT